MVTGAADEGWHDAGPERLWNESWYFDFFDPAGALGGYVRIGRYPNLGVVWYWACLVGEGRPLVTVLAHDLAAPRRDGSLELRGDGLWADHNCETPWDHWSLGLEAFGVGLDDPAEVYSPEPRGDRVGLAFDLEWETDPGDRGPDAQASVFRYPAGLDRYEVPCRVHGEILVGPDTIELDGWGQRDHSWGVRDWWGNGWVWNAGRLDDGTRFHGVEARITGVTWSIGYVGDAGGPLERTDEVAAHETEGPAGIPTAVDLSVGDLAMQCDPVAWAPVHLVDDGRTSRFPRGLQRVTVADGRRGLAWLEVNQPDG